MNGASYMAAALPQPQDCCKPCTTPATTQIPGPQGPAGANGTDGLDGVDSYTETTAGFTMPAVGSNVTVSVVNSLWMVLGQVVFVAVAGYMLVVGKPNSVSATLQNLGYSGGGGGGGAGSFAGHGSPEGVVTANPGATYLDVDTNDFWSKNSGIGNTGWTPLIV